MRTIPRITRVEFKTIDNVTLRGNFFKAAGNGVPCIVMTQGLSLLKEHYLQNYARKFVEAGFSCLVYDHRGFGSSDDSPRHETNTMQQAADYHDAITAAMNLSGVDRNKICLWGIGHSGGAAMIAAADEPRVAAIVLNMPFQSGAHDAANFPPGLLQKVWKDREAQTASVNPQPTYVPLWPTSKANARGEEGERTFLTSEPALDFITRGVEMSNGAGTPWENYFTLQSFFHLSSVEPRNYLPKIDPTKLLYIAAEQDPLTGTLEEHRVNFGTVKPGAEFAVVKPDHLATYHGKPFEEMIAVQVDFLKRKFKVGSK